MFAGCFIYQNLLSCWTRRFLLCAKNSIRSLFYTFFIMVTRFFDKYKKNQLKIYNYNLFFNKVLCPSHGTLEWVFCSLIKISVSFFKYVYAWIKLDKICSWWSWFLPWPGQLVHSCTDVFLLCPLSMWRQISKVFVVEEIHDQNANGKYLYNYKLSWL